MMNLRTLIVVGALGLLGFLLFPASETRNHPEAEGQWIGTLVHVPNEPLHTLPMYRNDPTSETYDLGFIYQIDRVRPYFKDPVNQGPKRYTIFGSDQRSGSYHPVFSYHGYSNEYRQGVRPLPEPVEARWLQVVLEDWVNSPPSLEVNEFRVGARYPPPGPVQSAQTNLNPEEANLLIDGLFEAPWKAADRRAKKEGGYEYVAPAKGQEISIRLDLGSIQLVTEVRVFASQVGNAPRRLLLSCHTPERRDVYSSTLAIAEGEQICAVRVDKDARFITLTIPAGAWRGEYAELTEIQVFTNNHQLYPTDLPDIANYSAIQAYYENCGWRNRLSPNLVQGFSYDRGDDVKRGERYLWREDLIEPGATNDERSFAYHYHELAFQYNQLDPSALYWVRVTYLQEKDGQRVQRLKIGPYVAHGSLRTGMPEADGASTPWIVGPGTPEQLTFAVPKDAYLDGHLDIGITRLRGPNAVVSELSLFEAREGGDEATLTSENVPWAKASRVLSPPTMDGSLTEWPKLYPLATTQGKDRLYLQWDDANLYVGGIIMNRGDTEADTHWDRLHLFIDTTFRRSPGMYTDSDHHFVLSHRRSGHGLRVGQVHHHMDTLNANIPNHSDVETAVKLLPNGYSFEARFPGDLALHVFKPASGQNIGFNYFLSGREAEEHFWASDNRNAPPSRWGGVELVSALKGQFELMSPETKGQISEFSAGETLIIVIRDPDRNKDIHTTETISVEVTGNRTGDHRTLKLTETDLKAYLGGQEGKREGGQEDRSSGVHEPPSLLTPEPANLQPATDSEEFAALLSTVYGTHLPDQSLDTTDRSFVVQGGELIGLRYVDPYVGPDQGNIEVTTSISVLTGATGTLNVLGDQGKPLEDATSAGPGSTGKLLLVDSAGQPIKTFRAGDTLTFMVEDADLIQEQGSPTEAESNTGNGPETSSEPVADPYLKILVLVELTHEKEEATLEYIADRKVYQGSLATAYAETPVPGDDVLQVAGAQQVSAVYTDRIQESGRTNAPVSRQALVLTGYTADLSLLPSANVVTKGGSFFFNAGADLIVRLEDSDLNQDPNAIERAEVQITGNTTHDQLLAILTETSVNSGLFLGTIRTQYATAPQTDSIFQVVGQELAVLSYLDSIQGTGATRVRMEVKATVNTGVDGVLSIVRTDLTDLSDFNAGDVLYFSVVDADEAGASIPVQITGDSLGDAETLRLIPSVVGVGSFTAPLPSAYSEESVQGDGILQVSGGELVTATYIDQLRASGETRFVVRDTARVNTGATGTLLVFSADSPTVTIPQFLAGQSLLIRVQDPDLNANSNMIETVGVLVQFYPTGNTADIAREKLTLELQETSGNAAVFEGVLPTAYAESAEPNDAVLQVEGYGSVSITYVDAIQDTGRTQVPLVSILGVATGQTGQLSLHKADDSAPLTSLSAGDRVLVKLADNDLNQNPDLRETAEVTAQGIVLQDQVTIVMNETDVDSGEYWGYLDTQDASRNGQNVDYQDNVLQVRDKEVIYVSYQDALSSTGEPNTQVEVRALVASSSAGILLIVDESGVEIGEFHAGQPLYFHLEDLLLTTAQQVNETTIYLSGNRTNDYVPVRLEQVPGSEGLFEGFIATRYSTAPTYDEVLDVQGNETVTATYRPDFLGIPGLEVSDTAYVSRGVRGKLLITRADGNKRYQLIPGTKLYFRLEDADLNADPFQVERADIQVGTLTAGPLERVVLRETTADAGIFVGSLDTAFGQTNTGLSLSGGETIITAYRDELVETGETHVLVTDTCRVNAVGYASFASDALVVDGINNRWDLNNPLATPNEEAYLWVEWDAENLYFFAQVQDKQVEVADPTRWYESADSLELHLDLEPTDQDLPTYVPLMNKPYVFWFCPKGGGPTGQAPYAGLASPTVLWNYAPPLQIASRFYDDYYVMEVAIPFKSLGGFDPRKSKRYRRIGFNFKVYRSNEPEIQWAQGGAPDTTTPLSQFGTLYFREPPQPGQ